MHDLIHSIIRAQPLDLWQEKGFGFHDTIKPVRHSFPSKPNKYFLYESSVLDAKKDARFFRNIFREIHRKEPHIYREDFCGTFQHSTEWIRLNALNQSTAIDLDNEPLAYGRDHHAAPLRPDQKKRLHILQQNVLRETSPKADLASAVNFSYFFFKERSVLLKYFRTVYRSLASKGLFILDVMGGPELMGKSIDRHVIDMGRAAPKLVYFWEQKSFNPITHEAKFAIHFKWAKGRIQKNVFTYDWRIWSFPELRDLLQEAGFQDRLVYWEGSNRKGEGNGIYHRTEIGEESEVFIAYLVGVKK